MMSRLPAAFGVTEAVKDCNDAVNRDVPPGSFRYSISILVATSSSVGNDPSIEI